MKNTEFKLKKPFVVWFIGCCFMIAGPANVIQVLYLEHIANWYEPVMWWKLFSQMSWLDQAVCASLPIAGVSLLIQRKNSWLLAVAFVLGACIQNLYCFITDAHLLYPVGIPMLANSAVLVVFYYFRYPYLDRRERLLGGISKRYPIALPVYMEGFQGVSASSISRGGCFLKFSKKNAAPAVNSTIRVKMDDMWIEGVVLYHDGKGCGVRFQSPRRLTRSKLRKIISLSKPVTERKAS